MDLKRSIRMAVDTGKVVVGTDKSLKLALNGGTKAIVVAQNCPDTVKQDFAKYCGISRIKVIEFPGSSVELGTVCGRPHPIAAMSVLEAGNSDIMEG